MQYLYHPEASLPTLELSGDKHRYLFKVRRHRAGERVHLRNLEDGILYDYRISSMDKKTALLKLESQEASPIIASKRLHIGWCMVDPKSIEKMLPTLNELGVDKITFVYCDRSQKQFKIDRGRLEKILLNSSQQCGRSEMMELDSMESMTAFMVRYPEAHVLHFSDTFLEKDASIETIVIGCEGGFSPEEIALFDEGRIRGLQTPLILRSESATVAVASTLLL